MPVSGVLCYIALPWRCVALPFSASLGVIVHAEVGMQIQKNVSGGARQATCI